MPETPELANDIQTIRYKIESIESTQHLLLRERRENLLPEILDLFDQKDALADVYLAVNGERSQIEIVEYLKANGVSASQPTVSRCITLLDEEALIQKAGAGDRGILWDKKQVLEKVLRLSHELRRRQQERACGQARGKRQ